MAHSPSPFDSDDELISAYLDDELSGDQRARVEARLATDPDAQRLLEQMRGVSAAVKSLPAGASPPEVTRQVERRIRELKATRGDATVAPSRQERSSRMWLWPLLAVAAALLVAFYDGRDEQLPDEVAKGQLAERELSEERTAAEIAPLEEAPPPEMRAAGEPAEALEAPPRRVAAPSAPPHAAPPETAELDSAIPRPVPEEESGEPPLIVNVSLSPEAKQNFERLLLSNGIRMEQEPAKDPAPIHDRTASEPAPPAPSQRDTLAIQPADPTGALTEQESGRTRRGTGPPRAEKEGILESGPRSGAVSETLGAAGEESDATPEDVEAVFVEAPVSQVKAFLSDLQQDRTNQIALETLPPLLQQAEPPARQLGEDQLQRPSQDVPEQSRASAAEAVTSGSAKIQTATAGGEQSGPSILNRQRFLGRAFRLNRAEQAEIGVARQLDGRTDSMQLGQRRNFNPPDARQSGGETPVQVVFVLKSTNVPSPAAEAAPSTTPP